MGSKVQVYVSDELKEALVRQQVPITKVCQAALEAAVDAPASRKSISREIRRLLTRLETS